MRMVAVIFPSTDYEDQETTHKHLAAEGRNRYVYNIFTVPWDFMNIRALIELLSPPIPCGCTDCTSFRLSIKVSTCWRPRVPVVPCSNPTRTEIIVLIDISLPGVVWRTKKVRRWRVLDCSFPHVQKSPLRERGGQKGWAKIAANKASKYRVLSKSTFYLIFFLLMLLLSEGKSITDIFQQPK